MPFLFLPSPVKQGRGNKAPAAPRPAASGHVGGHGEGKRERGPWGSDSPTNPGRRWRVEAGQHEPAVAGGDGCGGGAVG